MDITTYTQMAAVEDTHWWFTARRRVLSHLIGTLPLPRPARVLEAGCGSGGNLAMLSRFGEVSAFERNAEARERAMARGAGTVESGSLPDGIPFAGQHFDLIALLDVLEHIEDDAATLKALSERLSPGGHLLLTVPAFDFLWSAHDIAHHHFRRYRLGQVRALLEGAGYQVRFASYYNFFLFPLILLARKLLKADRLAYHLTTPPPWINRPLAEIFAAERFLLPRLRLPFGVSVVAIAQKA